jgi:tetratricopeptide (TPR) repeat protein
LAETRLNLDNYQGALDVLNEFGKLYFGAWYPASRAWVLMKLGKLDEAIRVARLGLLTEAEPGRTLNVLGILLSMTGKRQESLKVFNEAIMHELSMGSSGQPATPLNNSGEVYREIFNEEKAEAMWLKATSMPDGCEHVLPSMNLAIMFIEQLRLTDAKKAIDAFESCITQFPLRNGEEHRALVHLARGRIALHSGDVHSAVQHLEAARERRQVVWQDRHEY